MKQYNLHNYSKYSRLIKSHEIKVSFKKWFNTVSSPEILLQGVPQLRCLARWGLLPEDQKQLSTSKTSGKILKLIRGNQWKADWRHVVAVFRKCWKSDSRVLYRLQSVSPADTRKCVARGLEEINIYSHRIWCSTVLLSFPGEHNMWNWLQTFIIFGDNTSVACFYYNQILNQDSCKVEYF